MSNLITLACPSCGGQLEITNNTEQYRCMHCGNAHIVDPGVRAESLANEIELLKYNDQIRQVEAKIESLMQQQRQAWEAYGVAEAAVTKQRSSKQYGLFLGGASLIMLLIVLVTGVTQLVLVSVMGFIFGIIFYFVYDDAQVLVEQDSVTQQIDASRESIKRAQSELAQLRLEQTSKRTQSTLRSPVQGR